jgi:aspartate carbamoyltransferase catalytic subunit
MQLPHIISAKDFTRAQLDALFERAREIKEYSVKNENYRWTEEGHVTGSIIPRLVPKLADRTMALLFDQPSLRTSSSFETAMYALGGNCVTYRNASRESSIAKDESLEDTIEMLSGNPTVSVIVLRHPQVDAAKIAASVSSVPVINAGDGGEHPTQALVDLFTIQEALGPIEKLRVVLVGDINARTAKSLRYALSLYPRTTISIVTDTHASGTLLDAAKCSDVLYVLRPQKENWHKDIQDPTERTEEIKKRLERYYRRCTVGMQIMANLPRRSIVLHPRPRGPELPTEVDSDPRVLHRVQGRNGGPVRIALLEMMHSGEWQKLAKQ